MKIVISVEYRRIGQPQPYADSFYEFIMTFDDPINKEKARGFAKAIRGCRRFSDEGTFSSDMDKYFTPHLKTIVPMGDPVDDMIESGRHYSWHILIVENYTD